MRSAKPILFSSSDARGRTYLARALAAALLVLPCAAADFAVTDLGAIDQTFSSANGLNATGQAVGFSMTSTGDIHAFLTDYGVVVDLGTLADLTQSHAFAIAADGAVVGVSYKMGALRASAALWDHDGVTKLGDFSARDRNASGEVVGAEVRNFAGVGLAQVAVRYRNGALTRLGTLGGNYSQALGINDAGSVVGSSHLSSDLSAHAFIWINGAMKDLGGLGGPNSQAYDINEAGDVVGWSETTDGKVHAFLFTTDADGNVLERFELGDLGVPASYAYSVNAERVVVGTSNDRAFHWFDGEMHDLNNMIPAGSGWHLKSANQISDTGQIAGAGVRNGTPRAFVLTPRDCSFPARGDANCDGAVDFGDIDAFVLALTNPANYGAATGGCNFLCANDLNRSGGVDFDDIDPFVECLINGGCP